MNKNCLVVTMIILVILLTSCSMEKLEIGDKIIAPKNNLPPLEGKWIIEKVIDSPYKKVKLEDSEDFMDKEALFHRDAVVVGDQYILDPSYNIRNVNLSDYLLYNFKIDGNYLDIDKEEAEVITILANNQYFYEFIKYSENEMVTFEEEKFLFLKRSIKEISKEEVDRYINIEKNILRSSTVKELESLRSGVYLGIKTDNYDEINQIEDWKYKTIWIKSNNREISSAYEVEGLLVPRKKGFWLVDVNRENQDNIFTDKIESRPSTIFTEEIQMKFVEDYGRAIKPSILKNILYIGNDYISTEVIDKSTNKKKLQVYAIDNLERELPTMLSDILIENDVKSDSGLILDEENFGLVRRNGYWIMKGRVNYNNQDQELYKDYNIKTIPPKELVNYDDLPIPWSTIKSRFPNAVDAFISPNEDIMIIDIRNHIVIYPIQDNEILQKEIGRIKKDHDDTIVMVEWSLGRYTSLWEEEILKNNGKLIKYK